MHRGETTARVVQEALAADSMINKARPDAVLVALGLIAGCRSDAPVGDVGAVDEVWRLRSMNCARYVMRCEEISGAGCIFQTLRGRWSPFPPPRLALEPTHVIAAANRRS